MSTVIVSEDRKSFFARLALKISASELKLLDFAYDISKYSHKNQMRESGERYFEHCRASTLILIDELSIFDVEMLIAELIHDTVEDSWLMTVERISLIFGERVARMVESMTKKNDESPEEYASRISTSDAETIICKIGGDRLHNLRTLQSCPPEKIVRKLEETERLYIPLIDKISAKYPEIGGQVGRLIYEETSKLRAQIS